MECIILAGGLGTRIRSTIGEMPKCMAPVNGKPFLHYIFEWLQQQNVSHIILSLGYKHEMITEWLQKENYPFQIDHVIEDTPLGTGGGIQLALKKCKEQQVLVLNGDTLFHIDTKKIFEFHQVNNAETTIALKKMIQFERYGSVNVDEKNRIISFDEKRFRESGLINGGVYVINKNDFLKENFPQKFSFEKNYLETSVVEKKFFGKIFSDYFIDIGIPEDFKKAQEDFKTLFA